MSVLITQGAYPFIAMAMDMIAADSGIECPSRTVPEPWASELDLIEGALRHFEYTPDDFRKFCVGDAADQMHLIGRSHALLHAHKFLDAWFFDSLPERREL